MLHPDQEVTFDISSELASEFAHGVKRDPDNHQFAKVVGTGPPPIQFGLAVRGENIYRYHDWLDLMAEQPELNVDAAQAIGRLMMWIAASANLLLNSQNN